ncbi:class E sortase [Rubrobacter taiwanensis]|jgi:sortase A|nr:class E sortase [Rubrobacter taiwanensis]
MRERSGKLLPLLFLGLLAAIWAAGALRGETASAQLRFTEVRAAEEPSTTFVPANDGLLLGETSPAERTSGRTPPAAEPVQIPRERTPDPESRHPAADLRLTIPRLGIADLAVPTGSGQGMLDRVGILHLEQSGYPWEPGSNTYIAGHAIGYPETRIPYVFYELGELRRGDEILLQDPAGRTYTYRVYETLVVDPEDYWVTAPVAGRTIVSLQTCTPIPSFEKRLVVRGELVG